jgi:hypothetical protein
MKTQILKFKNKYKNKEESLPHSILMKVMNMKEMNSKTTILIQKSTVEMQELMRISNQSHYQIAILNRSQPLKRIKKEP